MSENESLTMELRVQGMSCQGCADRISSALSALPGIESADVGIGFVNVRYYPYALEPEKMRAAIEALGYRVSRDSVERNGLKRFLGRMAENNEKIFGHERLDCCTMKKK